MSGTDSISQTIYVELRRIAASHLARERRGHTLQPTALVHEAYLRLSHQDPQAWADRTHFLSVASQMMRRVLVDHARARSRFKRGSGETCVALTEIEGSTAIDHAEILDVDRAITRLADLDDRKARLVELRYFGGLTMEEVAVAMEASLSTVERDWRFARAFLVRELTSVSG